MAPVDLHGSLDDPSYKVDHQTTTWSRDISHGSGPLWGPLWGPLGTPKAEAVTMDMDHETHGGRGGGPHNCAQAGGGYVSGVW